MTHQVKVLPAGIQFESSSGRSILSSALSNSIAINYSCNNGSCGECKAKLIAGSVDYLEGGTSLSEEEKAAGTILTCCSSPSSDLTIEAHYYPELSGIEIKTVPCKVDSIEFVADDVAKLKLRLAPTATFSYLSGQYIDLRINNVQRSYSIANCSKISSGIELHIRKLPNGVFGTLVFEQLVVNQLLRFEGPKGSFFVRHSDRPIIFLAGGTGYAPVKAMVEQLLFEQSTRQIFIYWGVQDTRGIYDKQPFEWVKGHNNVTFVPVVSGVDDDWQGKRGFVHNAVLDNFESLADYDIYACGSPLMIEAAKKNFSGKEMDTDRFFVDSFVPSTN